MCNPCICGSHPPNYKNTPKGRSPTFGESYKCARNEIPLGTCHEKTTAPAKPRADLCVIISTALKFNGTSGCGTRGSDTLEVKMGTIDSVNMEKMEPFASPHLGKSEMFIASSFS